MVHKILPFLTVLSVLSSSHSSNSCYIDYREILSTPYIKFDIAADKDCWDYCKYEEQCTLFSVPKEYNETRSCSLYKENEMTLKYKRTYPTSSIYAVKNCLTLPHLNEEEEETSIFESSLVEGVIVYKVDTGSCLQADFQDLSTSPLNGYPVYWSSDCGDAMRWELDCVGIKGQLQGCSHTRLQAQGHPEYCTTVMEHDEIRTASMLNCSSEEDTLNRMFLNQGLVLTWSYLSKKWDLTWISPDLARVSITLPTNSPWDMTVNHTLDKIDFLSKEKLLDSPCRNLSVLHGHVLLNETVPMFLPGDEITVQCNPGFGAKFDNGSQLQVYTETCWMFVSLVDCSPLPSMPAIFGEDGNSTSGTEITEEDNGSTSAGFPMTRVEIAVFLLFLTFYF